MDDVDVTDSKGNNTSDEEQALDVIKPENPLLAPFQVALKEQLLQLIENLRKQIQENEAGLKLEEKRAEVLGVRSYNHQQIIEKQKQKIEETEQKLQIATSEQEDADKQLEDAIAKLKIKKEKFLEYQRQEMELNREVETMDYHIQQMSSWEEEIERHIKMNKQLSQQSRKEVSKLMKENIFHGGVIFRLTKQVWKLQNEIKTNDRYIEVKEEDRTDMAKKIAVGDASIDMLSIENKTIIKSWNGVVLAITNRDATLLCLKNSKNEANMKLKSMLRDVKQTKKSIIAEMTENEKLVDKRSRAKQLCSKMQTQYVQQLKIKRQLSKKLKELQACLDQIEYDLKKVQNESVKLKQGEEHVSKDVNTFSIKLHSLEEELYEKIRFEIVDQKLVNSTLKKIREVKENNSCMTCLTAEAEYKNEVIENETVCEKFLLQETSNNLNELQEQIDTMKSELDDLQEEHRRQDITEKQKYHSIHCSTQKYTLALEKYGDKGDGFSSKLQTKVMTLEKDIETIEDSNKNMQNFWLVQQKNLYILATQRQQQIQDINLLKKQNLILEQKNLKMNDEVAMHKKIEENMRRNVVVMENKLAVLCSRVCQKKGMKDSLHRGNDIKEQEYITRLEEAELDCLKIEEQLEDLEEEKVNLSHQLLNLNRMGIEWETKYTMLRETKEKMRQEEEISSQLSMSKIKNQRKKLILQQLQTTLRQTQENLIHSIYRREFIILSSAATMHKRMGHIDKSRLMLERRLTEFQNQNKQTNNQVIKIQERITEVENELKSSYDEKSSRKATIVDLNKEIKETQLKCRDAETTKMMNFDLLVNKQKVLNLYMNLDKDHSLHTAYKNESHRETEFNKQKSLNNQLYTVINKLNEDFPKYSFEYQRCLNILKIPRDCFGFTYLNAK